MSHHQQRRDRLRREVRKAGADALLVTNFTNVTYLTGFTGDDSYLFVRADGELLLSDRRYSIQLGEECPGLDVFARGPGQTMLATLAKAVKAAGIERFAIEADSMTIALWNRLAENFPRWNAWQSAGW